MALRSLSTYVVSAWLCLLALPALAVELVMVERQGCAYCVAWKRDIGPAYPNTEMGQFAPLRIVDIGALRSAGLETGGRVMFTPTFLLVRDGKEIGRIEGHPGEDFFWFHLHRLLVETAGYTGGS